MHTGKRQESIADENANMEKSENIFYLEEI
jgi:hypothetical protein